MQDGVEHHCRSVASEGWTTGRHFVKYGAKREEISARIEFFSGGLLRRHVCNGPDGCARACQMDLAQNGRSGGSGCSRSILLGAELGQTEIQNLGVAAFGHKDIGRLNITMDDSLGVSGIKRFGDL